MKFLIAHFELLSVFFTTFRVSNDEISLLVDGLKRLRVDNDSDTFRFLVRWLFSLSASIRFLVRWLFSLSASIRFLGWLFSFKFFATHALLAEHAQLS